MTVYGYARCSTNEKKQDISRQIRELQQAGVEHNNIYLEYESGAKFERVQLNRLLNTVKSGDCIIALELSRITRSTKQLCEIIEEAQHKGFKLVIGTFVVDCSKELDPMTEGMLKMMGVFAEMERNMIRWRVKSGIANARAKGKRVGRPPLIPANIPPKVLKAFDLYQEGSITKTDYARLCGISRPTLDKYLSLLIKV